MPSVALRVRRPPPEETDHRSVESVKPLFRANGGTDYLCGNFGAVMAAGMAPHQHIILDAARCSGCGAENEFPPHMRA